MAIVVRKDGTIEKLTAISGGYEKGSVITIAKDLDDENSQWIKVEYICEFNNLKFWKEVGKYRHGLRVIYESPNSDI